MTRSGREHVCIVRWTADQGKGDRLPILPLVTNFYIEDGDSAFLQNIDNATKRQKVQKTLSRINAKYYVVYRQVGKNIFRHYAVYRSLYGTKCRSVCDSCPGESLALL